MSKQSKLPPPVVTTSQDLTPIRSPLDIEGLELLFKNISSSATKPPSGITYNTTYANNWTENSKLNVTLPLTVQQFKFGQSNPTYLVTDANGGKFVLRRKPSANSKLFSKTAHAIEREFHMLDSIAQVNAENRGRRTVPVADVYLLCEDEGYIGCVFYLMEFVEGRIFHDASLSCIPEDEKMQYWDSAINVASNIHSIPSVQLFKKLPTKHFRVSKNTLRESNYFRRQASTLAKVHASQSKTVKPIPHFAEISNWLTVNSPPDPNSLSPNLIHGDFKMDNLVFHPTEPKVIAVLDWELCTNGHPLFDLANLLQPFVFTEEMNLTFSHFPIKPSPEFVKQMLDLYVKVHEPETWNPLSIWKVGVVFALFRVAVIVHGIAARLERGVASSAEAKQIANLFPRVGEFAYSIIQSGTKRESKM